MGRQNCAGALHQCGIGVCRQRRVHGTRSMQLCRCGGAWAPGSPEGQNRTAGTLVPYGFEVRSWGHPASPRHSGPLNHRTPSLMERTAGQLSGSHCRCIDKVYASKRMNEPGGGCRVVQAHRMDVLQAPHGGRSAAFQGMHAHACATPGRPMCRQCPHEARHGCGRPQR